MATFSKQLLSGSTDGRPVAVVATATPGTLIHTSDATDQDEVWIYAVNRTASDETLTIEFGGVTAADQIVVQVKKDVGMLLVIPGGVLTNSAIVRAFATAASSLNISGFVNRIT